MYSIRSYGRPTVMCSRGGHQAARRQEPKAVRREIHGQIARYHTASLAAVFLALAIGLLWIGQGTGAIAWPRSSFMINQLQWAGYGALLGAVGLILIWQGNR